ncbi:MAG: adenosylmethionine decarboxylase [Acidobacteriota bacterium]|nr:adenosylmethionine decarboxylase [Acidobacteriota bacterium]
MLVGTEWIIDAFDCDAEKLRDVAALRRIFSLVVGDLQLKVIDEVWHQFPGEGGVTGFNLLSESHLACHTYPEYRTATFNLYCCRTRPEWNWTENLNEMLGAGNVKIQKVERGEFQSETPNPKSKIAGGEAA